MPRRVASTVLEPMLTIVLIDALACLKQHSRTDAECVANAVLDSMLSEKSDMDERAGTQVSALQNLSPRSPWKSAEGNFPPPLRAGARGWVKSLPRGRDLREGRAFRGLQPATKCAENRENHTASS